MSRGNDERNNDKRVIKRPFLPGTDASNWDAHFYDWQAYPRTGQPFGLVYDTEYGPKEEQ
jgi:hypothetical protein